MINREILQELLEGADKWQLVSLLSERKLQLCAVKCAAPTLRIWFEKFELRDLTRILEGAKERFERKCSSMDITEEQRRNLLKRLTEHQRHCPHCTLKIDFDTRIDAVLHHEETQQLTAGHA